MDLLSTEQIEWIQKDIKRKGIVCSDLADDLLDHVCCMVEENIDNGLPFHNSYQLVIEKFGPAGFRKVQKETTFLLNLNSSLYKVVMAMDYMMTFILLIVSCSFIFAPLAVMFYQPTLFNLFISLPFTMIGVIGVVSGFDFKNFDTKRSSSTIRSLKITTI